VVDFTLTDEQKALREMAHDFAAKEIRPVAWQYDRDARGRRTSSTRRGSSA
jgi:acyl-CoA dehydrogenase